MGNLSANTLFHFTNSLERLTGIINNGFEPRYCEEFQDENSYIRGSLSAIRTWTMSFPMVCFCDIPLSGITNHIGLYGTYGIGLTKAWGTSAGLNPVHYVNLDSQALKLREQNITYLSKRIKKAENILAEATAHIPDSKREWGPFDLLRMHLDDMHQLARLDWDSMYLKPYSAKNFRGRPNYVFYDEKEWRYVPLLIGDDEFDPLQQFSSPVREKDRTPEEQAFHLSFLYQRHLELKAAGVKNLNFSPSDVKYLFVENDEKAVELVEHLKRSPRFTHEELIHLIMKITTREQIEKDS